MYINLDNLWKQYAQQLAGGFSEDEALANMRGDAVCTIRHEVRHVNDFKGNQNKPPDDFQEMIRFEELAYGEFDTWISTSSTEKFLVDELGAYDQIVSDYKAGSSKNRAWFKSRLNLSSDEAKAAMTGYKPSPFLPPSLKGNPDYVITDLYQTRAP